MTARRSQRVFVAVLSTSLCGCFTQLRNPNVGDAAADVMLDSWVPDAQRFDAIGREDAHETDGADDRPTVLVDVVDVLDTPNVACDGANELACNGVCVKVRSSVMHCGRCGINCPLVQDGTHECNMGACAFNCAMGFERLGDMCVRTVAPRPISPLSFGDVTDLRPTFRWVLPAHYNGVELQLCRTRACDAGSLIETIAPPAMATSVRPANSLAQRSVVFWRIRGRVGALSSNVWSPTWLFHVPARAMGVVVLADTSSNPHFDFNGDGLDDLAVGARRGTGPVGRAFAGAGSVRIFRGVAGVNAPPQVVQNLGGLTGSEYFGEPAIALGDVNGDGFGDLLVSSRGTSIGLNSGLGLVRLYLGSLTGLVVGPNGEPHATMTGIVTGDAFGIVAAGLGDVNRDGYADFAVGAHPAAEMTQGRVVVYSGSATGVAPMALPLSGNAGEGFGSSIAGLGDVNGDGYADMMIGVEGFDPGGITNAGKASLYLGTMNGLNRVPAAEFLGALASDFFGRSVGGAGDINGDGYGDFVVAAPNAMRPGRLNTGVVRSYLGANNVAMIGVQHEAEGTRTNDMLGDHAGSIGDFNGDGFADVAYTEPVANVPGIASSGAVTVMLGSELGLSNVLRFELVGQTATEYFGTMTTRNTDCNGDGYSDLFVGALNSLGERGRVYYYFGAAGNAAPILRGSFVGDNASDNFGSSVASLTSPLQRRVHRFTRLFAANATADARHLSIIH